MKHERIFRRWPIHGRWLGKYCGKSLAFALVLTTSYAVALPMNPGFETGELGPWYQDYFDPGNPEPAYSWAVTNGEAYSGAYSATTKGNNRVRQDFAPIAMEEVTGISFWGLAPPPKPNHSAVFGAYLFFSDRFLIFETFDLYSTDWRSYDLLSGLDFSDTCNPLTSGRCVVGRHLNGIGFIGSYGDVSQTIYVDDVRIERVVPIPPALVLFGFGLATIGAAARIRSDSKMGTTRPPTSGT
jgi:hypothetical protein